MNVALTSQLATVPLPSPASGFTYHVRSGDRHVRPLDAELRPDPRRSRRDDRPRQDRVRLHLSVLLVRPSRRRAARRRAGGLHARQLRKPAAAAPTSSRRSTRSRRRCTVHRRADLRRHRSDRSLAGRAGRPDATVAALERDHPPDRHRQQPRRALLPRSGCHRRLRLDPSVLRGRHRGRSRRSRGARQGDAPARGIARARGRTRRAHCRPATSRTCSARGRWASGRSRRSRRRSARSRRTPTSPTSGTARA